MSSLPKVGFVSLGCPKNAYDSERILTQLRAEGYLIVPTYQDADLVLVNTCGFIDAAVEESLDAIGEALRENGRVIVTGCLGARESVVKGAHPNVLAVTGPHATEAVMHAVHEHLPKPHDPYADLIPPGGLKLTPRHYAYLKISEGCNHRCTFCIIPSLRGDLVSRPIGDVLKEAEALVKAGVKEILVISQDTSAYGVDLKYRTGFYNGRPVKTRLLELVQELARLGIWVRLHYVYPYPSVDDVIPLMAEGKVLPYLDVPFQHASHRILKAMKRPAHAENVLRRIEKWREICPDIAIRSTFIVGFPVRRRRISTSCWTSWRPPSWTGWGPSLTPPWRAPRPTSCRTRWMRTSSRTDWPASWTYRRTSAPQNSGRRLAGNSLYWLMKRVGGRAVARSYADAPEIDGVVHIAQGKGLKPGDFVKVKITRSDDYDLWGKPL